MRERPISTVPKPALMLLAIGFVAQLWWRIGQPLPAPNAENLPPAPSLAAAELTSFGEPIALSKLLVLYIQTFDDQPGVSVPFKLLDYSRIQQWLSVALQLDPPSQYPLFLASREYSNVPDLAKQRAMYDFVYRQFFFDPNRRWRSLAYAAVMTKHHLHDLPKAQKYAQAIRQYATGKEVPNWARQMDIFLLEDMGEYDSARILLGELLRSGQITDQHELRFLEERLNKINAKKAATK